MSFFLGFNWALLSHLQQFSKTCIPVAIANIQVDYFSEIISDVNVQFFKFPVIIRSEIFCISRGCTKSIPGNIPLLCST